MASYTVRPLALELSSAPRLATLSLKRKLSVLLRFVGKYS